MDGWVIRDELDEYVEEQMRDPAFAAWWHRVSAAMPCKLPVDGHEYHRRQQARKKRRRLSRDLRGVV
jgi:hypothetical protein